MVLRDSETSTCALVDWIAQDRQAFAEPEGVVTHFKFSVDRLVAELFLVCDHLFAQLITKSTHVCDRF